MTLVLLRLKYESDDSVTVTVVLLGETGHPFYLLVFHFVYLFYKRQPAFHATPCHHHATQCSPIHYRTVISIVQSFPFCTSLDRSFRSQTECAGTNCSNDFARVGEKRTRVDRWDRFRIAYVIEYAQWTKRVYTEQKVSNIPEIDACPAGYRHSLDSSDYISWKTWGKTCKQIAT